MDWIQVISIIGANIVLVLMIIGINISMFLHTDKKIEAIQAEMKDFHGRLCAIEERNKKINIS